MTPLEFAVNQIEAARRDTLAFLQDLNDKDWFFQPFKGANHIAWLVGHIAVAEFGLTIGEVIGRRIQDVDWIPNDFRDQFKRGSTPAAGASNHATPAELRTMLDLIHAHVIPELRQCPLETLDEPAAFGHPLAKTKLEALHLCVRHESLHAGQIAMIRRALGHQPIR